MNPAGPRPTGAAPTGMRPTGMRPTGLRPTGMRVAYLDAAASTPLRPEATQAMAPFIGDRFANPSGAHRLARQARTALEEARDAVAAFVGGEPKDVVFTSGGTESANLAIIGALAALPAGGLRPVVVCSAVEHAAVLETCRAVAAGRTGAPTAELRVAPVDGRGVVDLAALADLLDDDVAVVSVMAANNEVGTLQPLDRVAELVRRRAPRALLHTDAVQAAPYLDLASVTEGFDLVTVSAHKLGGPKGTGAVVARGVPLVPLVFGGGQEAERRSGTQDVAGAVGMAAAMAAVRRHRHHEAAGVAARRDRLLAGLLTVAGARASVIGAPVLPGHCHVRFAGVDQDELVMLLDDAGVCAAAGSACASGATEVSHVLAAMGVPDAEARSGIRFSLGWSTVDADVDAALAAVRPAVERLARVA